MVPKGVLHDTSLYICKFKGKKICEKKCYVPEIIDKEIGQSLSTCTYKESFSIRDDTSSIRNGFKVAIVLLKYKLVTK